MTRFVPATDGSSVRPALLLAVLLAGWACAPREPDPGALRTAKTVELRPDAVLTLRPIRFDLPRTFRDRYGAAVDSVTVRIRRAVPEPDAPGIDSLQVTVTVGEIPARLDSTARSRLDRRDAYLLEIGPGGVRVVSSDTAGALHGLTAVAEIAADRGGQLPEGTVLDWPDHPVRAFHFVARGVSVESARRLIRLARENRFNTLMVQLADGVALESMGKLALDDAWSVEEFRGIVKYARENGLEFIPELKLLTHQGKLLKKLYPELMYNRHTYDPRKERTYEVVLPIVDEVLEIVEPPALHIGHDEAAGVGGKENDELPAGQEPLPAKLFLQDVRRLHSYLAERGVETWMWGDMLVGTDEFPGMLARHLHGVPEYTALRGRLPGDIVVNDWHYADDQAEFPSVRALIEAGHPTLGATWRAHETTRAFSRYVAGLGDPKARGMIATTWWLVQEQRWEELAEVAEVSGDAFWSASGSLR